MARLRQVKIMLALIVLCCLAGGALGASAKAGKAAARKKARTKSVNILLQEGLYAEETEGDLDKAIGIYEEVVEKAAYYQRIAARATYRLGLCYLKKGEKERAADYFQEVASNFPGQESLAEKAKKHLDEIRPPQQEHLPWEVLAYCVDRHMEAYEKAQAKGLAVNTLAYGVDDEFNMYLGGYLTYKNGTRRVMDGEISLGNFSSLGRDLYNEQGQPQKFRMVKRDVRAIGKYRLFWTPDRPVQPGEVRLLGYLNHVTKKLPETEGGHQLRMNNYFGSPVLENFFLVIPYNMRIAEQSSKYVSRKRLGIFEIYMWQREVPANTNNTVNAVLAKDREQPGARTYRPVVIRTNPLTYANDVSPRLSEISVTFNQKMADKSWSWVKWNYTYPETTGKPHYDATRTTCTLPVKLEPGTAYFVRINAKPYMSFRSAAGVSAQPYVLVFATKDENGNATPIPEDMLAKAREINAAAAPPPYTQELTADIDPDGTLNFKTTVRMINEGPTKNTTTFINSDFVNVTAMWDDKGKPLKFTSTHEGNIYRYAVTFNEPVPSGEMMIYSHQGTMTGLVNPVPGTNDSFHYYMRHSPSTGRPTLRAETFLLPEGAELVSTTPPDMQRGEKNGRIELHVEEIIPSGGALTTAFQYKLTGATSPQFTSKIYDNTALDLDTGAAVPLGTEWPDNLEITWDNDGGGAIMVKEQSEVRFITLPGVKKGKWADAVTTARNSIGVLKASTSSGVLANQTRFVAVLTSEGNRAGNEPDENYEGPCQADSSEPQK